MTDGGRNRVRLIVYLLGGGELSIQMGEEKAKSIVRAWTDWVKNDPSKETFLIEPENSGYALRFGVIGAMLIGNTGPDMTEELYRQITETQRELAKHLKGGEEWKDD